MRILLSHSSSSQFTGHFLRKVVLDSISKGLLLSSHLILCLCSSNPSPGPNITVYTYLCITSLPQWEGSYPRTGAVVFLLLFPEPGRLLGTQQVPSKCLLNEAQRGSLATPGHTGSRLGALCPLGICHLPGFFSQET